MKTCRDESDSLAAFRPRLPLKIVRQMGVGCVRRRKFANVRLAPVIVTRMVRSVTIFVAIASIAAENRASVSRLKPRKHRLR